MRPQAAVILVSLLVVFGLWPAVASATGGPASSAGGVAGVAAPDVSTDPVLGESVVATTRLGGPDRYDVAYNSARELFFDGQRWTNTVAVVACGSDRAMADPLSAAGLAGSYDAPLLLVRKDTRELVPPQTLQALEEMTDGATHKLDKILIVGGPASVTPYHHSVLSRYAKSVVREGGADRYVVAANVASEIQSHSGRPPFVLIAGASRASRFYEPLAAGPICYANKVPLLLVRYDDVPPSTTSALVWLGVPGSDRFVVGGPSSVPSSTLARLGYPTRISGSPDRDVLAADLARFAVARGWLDTADVGVTNKIADSLTAAATMGRLRGPLLYTDPSGAPPLPGSTDGVLSAWKDAIRSVHVLGGTASVTDQTLDAISSCLLGGQPPSPEPTTSPTPTLPDHQAVVGDNVDPGELKACGECHSMDLLVEHTKLSSSGPQSCATCHPEPEGVISLPWNGQCSACHGADAPPTSGAAGVVADVTMPPAKHHDKDMWHATTALPECVICHTGDLTEVHRDAVTVIDGVQKDACLVCHAQPGAPDSLAGKTCTTCHPSAFEGHYDAALHASGWTGEASCGDAGCHDTTRTDLLAIHQDARPTFACADCHASTRAEVVSAIAAGATACDACHTVHGPVSAIHASTFVASPPVPCQDCHATTDLPTLHDGVSVTTGSGQTLSGCDVCHAYFEGAAGTRVQAAITAGDTRCSACHFTATGDVAKDHSGLSVAHSAPADATCSSCHTTGDVRGLHASRTEGACAVCHDNPSPTRIGDITARSAACVSCHAAIEADLSAHPGSASAHVSTQSGCAGSGCHAIADVRSLHAGASVTVSGVTYTACAVCHRSPGQQPASTDCVSCHGGADSGAHAAQHDTSGVVDPGCFGCHFSALDAEHLALGYTCATCHASTNQSVASAITNHRRECSACHPAVNGRDSHEAQDNTEFVASRPALHRVNSSLPGARSSFSVAGSTYTWSLPSASSWLKTGWAADSVMDCGDCHSHPAGSPAHGSAVAINIDPAYPDDWDTATLGSGGAIPSALLCSKCHLGASNAVHQRSDHRGRKCVVCHTGQPHSGARPRMLAYSTDPAPYGADGTGLLGFRVKDRTPSGWSSSDCWAGCHGEHNSAISNPWPSAGP